MLESPGLQFEQTVHYLVETGEENRTEGEDMVATELYSIISLSKITSAEVESCFLDDEQEVVLQKPPFLDVEVEGVELHFDFVDVGGSHFLQELSLLNQFIHEVECIKCVFARKLNQALNQEGGLSELTDEFSEVLSFWHLEGFWGY